MYWAYLNPEVHWLVIRACNNMSRVANKVSTNPMMTDPSFFLTQYISRGENFWTWVGAHFSLVPEMKMKSIYQDRILKKKCQVICLLLVSFFKEGWQTLKSKGSLHASNWKSWLLSPVEMLKNLYENIFGHTSLRIESFTEWSLDW